MSLLESIQDGNTTEYFGYDDNGNLHRHASVDEDWVYFWDEANRLRSAVINGIKMMHYIYDASGERTLKAQTEYQGVFENGTPTDEGSTLTVYTTYPSPYLTVSPDKKFTNHYYAGSQRIASKPAGNADRFNVLQIGDTPNLEELRAKQLADAQFVADSMELGQLNLAQSGPGIIITPTVFYFHPDHLGSSTLITNNFGDSYQFFLNLPFGETFAEQRLSGTFNSPYKFNGKELDEETGLYYYGARYYNPRTSVWLSVDPLTEQTMTPYQYTYQNPVRYIDPDGKAPYDHIFTWKNGKLTMYDNKNGSSLIYINGILMSDLDLDVKQNRVLIANVAAYYANSIGHKTNVYGGKGKMIFGLNPYEKERESSSINPAFTYGNDIYINSLDFNLNCEISDYYDFISIIEHEVIHKESNHGFNVINSLDHAEVYMKQIESKNFDKTTSRFKKSMINSFVNQLNEANKELGIGIKQVEMMNSVNNRLEDLGVEYRVHEKLGSGNYEIR